MTLLEYMTLILECKGAGTAEKFGHHDAYIKTNALENQDKENHTEKSANEPRSSLSRLIQTEADVRMRRVNTWRSMAERKHSTQSKPPRQM